MAEQRVDRSRFRRSRVLIAVLAAVVLIGSAYVVLGPPGAINAARARCVTGDVAELERPPIGNVGAATALRPAGTWADDVGVADGPPLGVFFDVDATADQAVAVGRIEAGGGVWRPLIATTSDGRDWRMSTIGGVGQTDGDIVDVVAGGPGWLAAGSVITDDRGGSAGVVWWSDDGSTWQRGQLQPVAPVHRIAVGEDGMLALGSDPAGSAWLGSSVDGLHWEWRDPGIGRAVFEAIAWASDGWVAGGRILLGGDDALPAVWRSANGVDWSCRLLPTPRDVPYGWTTSVLPGGATTLITGAVNQSCSPFASCAALTASWVATADGAWRLIEAGEARAGLATVAPDGSFVALDGGGVWLSIDGVNWQVVARPPEPGVPGALAVLGQGIVSIGATYGAGVRPWVGLLPNEP
ncbi:MAG: hypothetical protein AABZ33_03800 [Chloroflexota bacterium]